MLKVCTFPSKVIALLICPRLLIIINPNPAIVNEAMLLFRLRAAVTSVFKLFRTKINLKMIYKM